MKKLFFDTETAPTLAYVYGRYDLTVRPDQVVDNGFFLSYQAAWDDGKIFTGSLRGKKNLTSKDDKKLCMEMANLIAQADVVIAHNADRFDLARLSARLVTHGLKPFTPPAVVDTLKACRRFFKFEANSLDSVCQELGLGRKFHSGGFETSLACMRGEEKAWNKLLLYGKQDVVLLRELYYRLRPWMKNHPNHNLYDSTLNSCCHACGKYDLEYRGYRHTPTMSYHRFQCKDCGAWGQERKNCIDKEKKDVITRGV